jgi:hypothetical protein
VGRLLAAVEDETGEISSASGSLQVSSESLRCLLAGRSTGEEDAAGGFIREEWEKIECAQQSGFP